MQSAALINATAAIGAGVAASVLGLRLTTRPAVACTPGSNYYHSCIQQQRQTDLQNQRMLDRQRQQRQQLQINRLRQQQQYQRIRQQQQRIYSY